MQVSFKILFSALESSGDQRYCECLGVLDSSETNVIASCTVQASSDKFACIPFFVILNSDDMHIFISNYDFL